MSAKWLFAASVSSLVQACPGGEPADPIDPVIEGPAVEGDWYAHELGGLTIAGEEFEIYLFGLLDQGGDFPLDIVEHATGHVEPVSEDEVLLQVQTRRLEDYYQNPVSTNIHLVPNTYLCVWSSGHSDGNHLTCEGSSDAPNSDMVFNSESPF